ERSDWPANVLRLMFDPEGLRPFVANWEQVAEALVQRGPPGGDRWRPRPRHRGAAAGAACPSRRPGPLARAGLHRRAPAGDPGRVRKGRLAVSYFSMVATVGTPQDITAEEIRLESFFPADQATETRRWT
ncbi:MAG TPA: transcriptional regulator, partial [Actinomycetes bacterium]|nr:transcriptional regulator [Actinomycetes bacterium]